MNAEIERKWQKIWQENRIFEPLPGGKKFFITVPYPYSNGPLHIGHGRTYTYGDVIARFMRMKGYNVLFPMAFHVTGTPILTVSDSIRQGNMETVELYREYIGMYENDKNKVEEILKSFEDPEKIALFFAEKIQRDFESLGYSIDWRKKFHTAEKYYNRFVEWQYKKLFKMKYLKKGDYPITYSPADGNPVGEDDIKDGDTDKVTIIEFVAIKYRFEDGFIPAATLRPETTFGVVNIWVNPEAKYYKIKDNGEIYFVSRESYEKLIYQRENVSKLDEYDGKYFVNKTARNLLTGEDIPVLPAGFVDPDNATGFVQSVPAHAPYDYAALRDINSDIRPKRIIDIDGYGEFPAEDLYNRFKIKNQYDPNLEEATKIIYRDEFYSGKMSEWIKDFGGMRVSEAKEKIKKYLIENGMAFLFYETSRKAVTRSGNKVIVAIIKGQWFLDYSNSEWKRKTHYLIDKMDFYPEIYRTIFHEVNDWLKERPCVRRRGLGTEFPFEKGWIIESLSDSTIYPAFYTIIDRIRERNIPDEKLDEKFFDYVFLNEGPVPFEEAKYIREGFTGWYPNDLRISSNAHVSNHFIFYLFHHTAIFPEKYYPGSLMILGMLIREGAKMSKSKGNVIPLVQIAEKYSADLFRLYIISSSDFDKLLDWKEEEIKSVRGKLEKFAELLEESIKCRDDHERGYMENYLINSFYMRYMNALDFMNRFKFRDAVIEIFYNFMNDIKYYEKRENPEKRACVLKVILEDWLKIVAPIIPHTAEEYWNRLGKNSFISLERLDEMKEYDRNLILSIQYIENLIEDIKNIINVSKIVPDKIYIYLADERKRELLKILKEDKNRAFREAKGKDEISILKQALAQQYSSVEDLDEEDSIRNNYEYLKRMFSAEIVINPSDDPGNKKRYALPGKPSIFIIKK
ncbi:MAG: leucine--tRNA ligase [Thermoplasmata archaeon]